MAKSKIEWTEVTWNPVTGCTKISPGCKNCYAETIANRFWGERKFTDIQLHKDRLQQPLHWKKPRMIFVNSMSDLFHEAVPFEFIDKVLTVMATNPRHTYQILTKRPERLLEFSKWQSEKIIKSGYGDGFEFPNFIWIGISVENQKTADERIPILLQVPATVKWISAEPLLEKIDLGFWIGNAEFNKNARWLFTKDNDKGLNWVVVGGESGPNKRTFSNDWARSIRDACKHAQVPFFMKQIDKIQPIPKDLQIREYPKAKE